MLYGQTNPINKQALGNAVTGPIYVENATVAVDSKNWRIDGLLYGGYGSFPISSKVSFDTKAMIGLLTATYPGFTVTVDLGPFGSGGAEETSASSIAFSYLLGCGFKYDAGHKVCLLANIDYLGYNVDFKNVKTTTGAGIDLTNNFSQSSGTVSISVGVGLCI